MHKVKLRNCDNTFAKLIPVADFGGVVRDGDWHVRWTEKGLELMLGNTYGKLLDFEFIHHWSPNPNGGISTGILHLTGRLIIKGDIVTFKPGRPVSS